MNIRRWIFLLAILFLVFGYIFLFYKKYDNTSVPGSADIVAVVDIKNVARSYLKEFILHPSRWFSTGRKRERELNWRKIFVLPDYLCFFHCAGQTADKWYLRLQIKNRKKFNEALELFHFQRRDFGERILYSSSELGIHFFVERDNVILASYPCSATDISKVEMDLFSNHKFLSGALARSFVNTDHHGVLLFRNGRYFSKPGSIGIDVKGAEVNLVGAIFPKAKINPQAIPVSKSPRDVLNLSLAPIPSAYLNFFSDSMVHKWSQLVGLPVDSLFLNDRYSWTLTLHGFRQRADTAISFELDENFMEVKKSILIHSTEPVMELVANGEEAGKILSLMQQRGMLENEMGRLRFTGFPLWPLFVSGSTNKFILGNYENPPIHFTNKLEVGSLEIYPSRIPDSLFRFIPDGIRPWFRHTGSISLQLKPSGNAVMVIGKMIRKEGTYF